MNFVLVFLYFVFVFLYLILYFLLAQLLRQFGGREEVAESSAIGTNYWDKWRARFLPNAQPGEMPSSQGSTLEKCPLQRSSAPSVPLLYPQPLQYLNSLSVLTGNCKYYLQISLLEKCPPHRVAHWRNALLRFAHLFKAAVHQYPNSQ